MSLKVQHIGRVGILAVALGIGTAVANTPGVALAEPTDSSSSTSSSDSSSSASSSSSDPQQFVIDGSDVVNKFVGLSGWLLLRFDVGDWQGSVDAQTSSTSPQGDASTADPRSGIVQSSGGAHTSSTPSSSDTTASAGDERRTQTGVPAAAATAAPAEPPAAALPTQQPNTALPTEQPAAPAPSAEPVPSLVAREAATPETPVATAAAPTPDAPHGESHTAPNSAGSDPTNRSGSASSTSANRQSTVAVGAAATPASTAQPRTATEAAVESVASTYSAAEGAVETRAVPVASSAPLAPPNVISGVVSSVLAWVGLSPSVSNTPLAPVDSPALWAVLAWARRQNQQTLIDETPTVSKTPAQSSQTVDSVVTDITALSAPMTPTPHCRRR